MPSPVRLFNRFRKAGINGRLDLNLALGEHLRIDLKGHTVYDYGPEIYGKPRNVSLLISKTQLARCLIGRWSIGVDRRHPVTFAHNKVRSWKNLFNFCYVIRSRLLVFGLSSNLLIQKLSGNSTSSWGNVTVTDVHLNVLPEDCERQIWVY